MEILLPGLQPRRKAAGLTQQQLADQAEVSIGTVSKHEQGAINGIDGVTLNAFCRVLNCTKADLLLPANSDTSEISGAEVKEA